MNSPKASWLQSFQTQSKESKAAMVIALIATIVVTTVVIWTSFFKNSSDVSLDNTTVDKSIHITEKPNLQVPTTLETNKPIVRQAQKTQSVQPKPQTKTAIKPQRNKQQIVLGQGNYYVQVGAVKQSKLARLMLEKMKTKYRYAKIVAKPQAHAVWVGPVVTRQEASKLKKIIQQRDNIQGFITTKK